MRWLNGITASKARGLWKEWWILNKLGVLLGRVKMEMILGYSVRKMFTKVHHKCNDLKCALAETIRNKAWKVREKTSLIVQWIRIRLPMQGTWVQSLVQEDSTCFGAIKPVHHICWPHVPHVRKPQRLELVLHQRSRCNEKPVHHTEEQPPLTSTSESLCPATKIQGSPPELNK